MKLDAMVEFLKEERAHQRALGWMDKDSDPPEKSDLPRRVP